MMLDGLSWEAYWKFLVTERKIKISAKNKDAYYSRFNGFIKAFRGKEFSRENFNEFIYKLLENGSKQSHINKFINMARHFDMMLGTEEMKGFTRFREDDREERIILSVEELQILLEAKVPYTRYAQELERRNFIVIHFLFQTGCRCDELQKLEWRDLQSVPEPNVIFRSTKSRNDRRVFISQWMYTELQKMPHYCQFIFGTRNGNMFGAAEFNRTLKTLGYYAKLPEEKWRKISIHTLRHSRATYLATFIDPFLLGKILGHSDVGITMQYYHPSLKQLVNAAYNNPLQTETTPIQYTALVAKELIDKMCDARRYNTILAEMKDGGFNIEVKKISKE